MIPIESLKQYFTKVLGKESRKPWGKEKPENLPLYLREQVEVYTFELLNQPIALAKSKTGYSLNVQELESQLITLRTHFGKPVIMALSNLSSLDKKRLIEKKINFVVANKQLFLPELLIDLREHVPKKKERKDKLIPSTQALLLYHLLHPNEKTGDLSLKGLAERFGYSQMVVTKIADDLAKHELCKIKERSREKFIYFHLSVSELWEKARPLLVSPVIKRVYTEMLPSLLLKSNLSALSNYTDKRYSNQEYWAIDRNLFYSFEKAKQWSNLKDNEGRYCLEVWKYHPRILTEDIMQTNVDPLSLYLSLIESADEQMKVELNLVIKKYIVEGV